MVPRPDLTTDSKESGYGWRTMDRQSVEDTSAAGKGPCASTTKVEAQIHTHSPLLPPDHTIPPPQNTELLLAPGVQGFCFISLLTWILEPIVLPSSASLILANPLKLLIYCWDGDCQNGLEIMTRAKADGKDLWKDFPFPSHSPLLPPPHP